MKILILGFNFYNYSDSLAIGLRKNGHEVKLILDSINESDIPDIQQQIIEYNPDLFINYCGNYRFNIADSILLKKLKCPKVYMLVDKYGRCSQKIQNVELYDKVYAFESEDVFLLQNMCGKKIGLTEAFIDETLCNDISFNKCFEKEYDIVFVGGFDEKRKVFFENLAEFAYKNKLKMGLFSHFYSNKYIWQKIFSKLKFKVKYPFTSKYIVNKNLSPIECQKLYKKSKICINYHVGEHKAMNYRVFEIMANNNFCLCDYREDFTRYGLVDGNNIAVFYDIKDCFNKIRLYLNNEKLRENISYRGGAFVRDNYTNVKVMKKFLNQLKEENII